ncbi:MAG TPA: prolyl oligopeptidase family serine peptidase, partial [Chloroflexota bacterium]|nr:prolyl oligopeptidase family serine peptidase [Chloroflexota bacterium]
PLAAWSPDPAGPPRLVFRSNRSGWAKLWTATFRDLEGERSSARQAGAEGLGEGEDQEGQAASGFEVQPLTAGAWDDYAFRLAPDGQRVVFASRAEQDGSADDLWTVPLSGGPPTRLTNQGGVNVPYGWAPDGRVLYWHSSPTEPGDLWAISTEPPALTGPGAPSAASEGAGAGGARRLTWSAPAEVERKLRPPEEAVLTGAEGQRVHALVYLPAGHQEGQRHPPIVWVRGGPTGFSRFDYAPLLSWLANEGFLVVTPNYRGSTGHGVEFMAAVAGEGLGQNDLADVLAAAEYARGHPCADPQRGVGVGGRSWGGYLTLMAVTRAPEVFSCAVAGAAISDWTVQQAQTETRAYDRWLVGGWLYEQEARARDRSPVTHAGQITAPLLVYHGEADLNVPFAQIGPFVERARQAGAAVELVTYPLEGHGNALPQNQRDVLEKTRAFFRRHLQPWNFRDNPTAGQVP